MNLNNGKINWYAIYTKSRAEKKVCERLEEAGFEAYLPLKTKIKQWSDRKKKVSVPLINSYVFVHVEESQLVKTLTVFGTVMVLKHYGSPAIVKDYEIENLRILTESEANIEKLESTKCVEIGDDIEIDNGPYWGLKGKCADVQGKKSIIIEFESFGDIYRVDMPLKYIKMCK